MSEHDTHLRSLPDSTVLVAGLGNIGSTLPGLLLQAGVGTVRLVDRDTVEAKNLTAQDYRPEDIGRPKAEALADRLRQRFPGRSIEAWASDLEDLPRGVAACDLLVGGLDSRRARQVLVGEIAWPLGVPVVDGGVGDGHRGRVQVFVPGAETACLECTWGSSDYRLAAAEYPCQPGGAAQAVPTGAPAYLGSFTASLMTRVALSLLRGEPCTESYEIVFDLDHLILRRFGLRRSPRCRHDHVVIEEVVPVGDRVGQVLAVIEERFQEPVSVQVRRGLGRFLTVDALKQIPDERLSAKTFLPEDRICVRTATGGIWLSIRGDDHAATR